MKRARSSRIKRLWGSSRRSRNKGFTLLELLVVTAIGAVLVSGLMFIVVQLMETDQREASRSETQREMQLAMDYISTELREAVYVYTGAQLKDIVDNNFLPTSVTNNGSVPVLAFWRQNEFPDVARDFCKANKGDPTKSDPVADKARAGINCEAGSSYALIVYSIRPKMGNWQGEAQLTRYALTEFKSTWKASGTPEINKGYVNPSTFSNFPIWPSKELLADKKTRGENLQSNTLDTLYLGTKGRPIGQPNGDAFVLVDFVAFNSAPKSPNCINPTAYVISPASPATSAFYACLRPRINEGAVTGLNDGDNQEVVLFLQGSVSGRPGYTTALGNSTAEKLPALETRVLTRGVRQRSPRTN